MSPLASLAIILKKLPLFKHSLPKTEDKNLLLTQHQCDTIFIFINASEYANYSCEKVMFILSITIIDVTYNLFLCGPLYFIITFINSGADPGLSLGGF